MNDDLNAESLQLIAAYQAELRRRPSRPSGSWKALERRIAADEEPLPAFDEEPVRSRRWRWVSLPLAAASLAMLSWGWKTLRAPVERNTVAAVAPFESVARVDEGETPSHAPEDAHRRRGVRVELAPTVLEALAPTAEDAGVSPQHLAAATYETRNAAARQRASVRSTRHRRTRPAQDTRVAAVAKSSSSTIEAEAALLAKGRSALRDGRPGDALTYVAEHARLFPQGSLAQERAMLKVAARCDAGDRDTARTDAQEFIRRYPSSPLRARVLALCARGGGVR